MRACCVSPPDTPPPAGVRHAPQAACASIVAVLGGHVGALSVLLPACTARHICTWCTDVCYSARDTTADWSASGHPVQWCICTEAGFLAQGQLRRAGHAAHAEGLQHKVRRATVVLLTFGPKQLPEAIQSCHIVPPAYCCFHDASTLMSAAA